RHPQETKSDIECMLRAVARLWVVGHTPEWKGFYSNERRYRIPLPTYPFERQKYWIERGNLNTPAAPNRAELRKNPDVGDWFYTPSWQQATPVNLLAPGSLPQQANWLIFEDDLGLGSALSKQLEMAGFGVTCVGAGSSFAVNGNSYSIDPRNLDD